MKILLLEDDPKRIMDIKMLFIGHTIDVYSTVYPTIVALNRETYDVIMLDHDLTAQHYEVYHPEQASLKYDEHTGYAVAKYLAEHDELSPDAEIILHSMNRPQVKRMRDVLRKRYPQNQIYGTDQFYQLLRRLCQN